MSYETSIEDNHLVVSVTQLPIDALEKRCLIESQRFQRTGQSDSQYGYELSRRALAVQSEVAWESFMRVYTQLVAHWVRSHPGFVSGGEDESYYVNRSFERLWRNVALKPKKFEKFATLNALLRFLKLCSHAAVLDDGLRRTPQAETPLHEVEPLLVGQQGVVLDGQNEFWQLVDQYLKSEAERVAIAGFFVYNIKNRELVKQYPHLFASAKQLSNLRLTVLRRLARVPAFEDKLRAYIEQDETLRFGRVLTC